MGGNSTGTCEKHGTDMIDGKFSEFPPFAFFNTVKVFTTHGITKD